MCFQIKAEKGENVKFGLQKKPLLSLSLVFLPLNNDDRDYKIANKYYHESKLGDLIHKYNSRKASASLKNKQNNTIL